MTIYSGVAAMRVMFGLGFIYLQTVYVLDLVKNIIIERVQSQSGDIIRMDSIGSKSDLARIDTSSLEEMLKKEETFEIFMDHLSREWSMECLLAFVEISQFQLVMSTEFGSVGMDLTDMQQKLLDNKDLEKSFIVYHKKIEDVMIMNGMENVDEEKKWDLRDRMIVMKLRAVILYGKYVADGDLQINISYEQHQKLMTYLGDLERFINRVNMNAVELFELWNDVILELSKLLSNSYSRFLQNNMQ